jgi:PAS domain S-box-containing protein
MSIPPQQHLPEEPRRVLSRAAQLLASSYDFQDMLAQTIGACLPALGDFGFFDVAVDGQVRRTARAHEAPAIEALLSGTQWARQEGGTTLNLCALSSGQPALHPDIDDAWMQRCATSPGHLELMRQLAFTSMVTVPMQYRDETIGALTLFMGHSGRRHTPEHLDMAAELAMLAAPVVFNARLLELHRKAEASVRAREGQVNLAIEAGQLGIWDWDVEKDIVTWSDRVYELHGLALGDFGGSVQDFEKLVHPEDRQRVGEHIARALEGGQVYSVEFRVPLPDGKMRWLTTRAHVVRNAAGRAVRMVGATSDVTERAELLANERAARAAAEDARRRLELLAVAGAELSRSLDPQATLMSIAQAIVPVIGDWCRIDLLDEAGQLQRAVAYHSDPEKSRDAWELVNRMQAAPGTVGSMAQVIQTGQSHYGKFDLAGSFQNTKDPVLRSFTQIFGMHAHYILPLTARGRTLGALAVVQAESGRDLSEDDRSLIRELAQRAALALDNSRLYAEAEIARSQAETANRAKDEFLAMLGHELRNPLAPIVTSLELMARRGDESTSGERAVIGRQVTHLSRLVDDLLDVSRITRGKIQLQRDVLDMKAIVARALELTQPVLEKRERPVKVEIPPQPAMVSGDAVRLTQVLCNLLTNAAKFTPSAGHIGLRLQASPKYVQVTVEDSGAGISPSLLPRVFDLFVQGDQPLDRQVGGLGLGLAIVKTLVQMHGGTVGAASPGLGRGSSFAVRLPAAVEASAPAVHEPEPQEAPTAVKTGARILLVDDNTDAGETLAELLREVGYDVRTAADGPAGLAVLDAFVPELGILDIGLPGMDGYELARRLRADPRTAGLKLIALTGYGREGDRSRALASDFQEHLVKPVSAEKLLGAIEQLLSP